MDKTANTPSAGAELIDLATKRRAVEFSVHLKHHWDDHLEIFVMDIADDDRSRASAADSLRRAADMLTSPDYLTQRV